MAGQVGAVCYLVWFKKRRVSCAYLCSALPDQSPSEDALTCPVRAQVRFSRSGHVEGWQVFRSRNPDLDQFRLLAAVSACLADLEARCDT